MRRLSVIIMFGIILVLFFNLKAQNAAQAPFLAKDPVLITSAGQSADILMVKILAKKTGLNFTINKTAAPENLAGIKSVIVVCGGSTKGLGAAKIDKKQEYERVEKLIKAAKKKNIPVIAVHVGGKSRRGALSDYFNKLVAENASHIIVVKNGNQDKFFSNIAKEKKITIDISEKIIGIQDILKSIYQSTKSPE